MTATWKDDREIIALRTSITAVPAKVDYTPLEVYIMKEYLFSAIYEIAVAVSVFRWFQPTTNI